MVHPENRLITLHSPLSLEFGCTEPLLGSCDESDGHHPYSNRQVTAFHDYTTFDTRSEATASTMKGLFVFKLVVIATGAPLADDSLLDSLFFDEFNTRRFVWKPINEIDNVHGQNRLF